jgi:hypothetical protein
MFAIAIRFTLPRVFHGPNICRKCGYDVRGSLGFHRCPECGTSFHDQRTAEALTRRPSEKVVSFLNDHPATPVLALAVCFFVPTAYCDARSHIRGQRWSDKLQTVHSTGGEVDLTQAAPFEWQEVLIAPPYADCKAIQQMTGLPFQDCLKLVNRSGFTDAPLAIFLENQKIVEILPSFWPEGSCELVRIRRDRPRISVATDTKCVRVVN